MFWREISIEIVIGFWISRVCKNAMYLGFGNMFCMRLGFGTMFPRSSFCTDDSEASIM